MQDKIKLNRIAIILLVLCISVFAQTKPYQIYNNNPAQMVAFSADTRFEDAINILGKLSMQFEGKTIVDPTFQEGEIGIDIPQMPWKTAFQRIVSERRLEFQEFPNYYQIIATDQAGSPIAGVASVEGPEFDRNTREVKINAIFFQADRTKLHNAGINWEVLQNGPGFSLRQLNIGADFGVISAQSGSDEGTATGRRVTHTSYEPDGAVDVTALLNLFESKDLGKILSKPTITVVDGKQGEIHVGTQFSINQRDFAGNTVTRFANAGTILRVTPNIIKDTSMTFIHMTIEAEKSSARAGLGDRPEIDTQKASTDILMTDGEQTMIGGLFTQDKTETRSGIPLLKDLPWWFFGIRYVAGYNSTKVSRKELLIFIQVELLETLEDRFAHKKKELLSKQLKESSNEFREEFADLDGVASDIFKKNPGKPLEDKTKKEDIDKKIDEQLNQEMIVTPSEETVKVDPEPIKLVEKSDESIPETKVVDSDTKKIIKKFTEEEQQSTDAVSKKPVEVKEEVPKPVAVKVVPKKETPKAVVVKKPPVIKEEPKPEPAKVVEKPVEEKVETKQIEKPVEKKVEKKIDVTPPPPPIKKVEPKPETVTVEKKDPKPSPVKVEKKIVEKTDEVKTETVEKTSINDEPSLKPRYTIQIFSSDDYEKTMEEIALFKEKGIEVYIIKINVDGKLFYRVRSGQYRNFSDAKRDMKNIQKHFPERNDMWIDNL